MSKALTYSKNGAIAFGAATVLFNAVSQLIEMNRYPNKKFDWIDLLCAGTKGAAVGAAGGVIIGGILDEQNSKVVPIATAPLLKFALNNLQLDKDCDSFIRLSEKAIQLELLISNQFKGQLVGQIKRTGSTEEGTSLGVGFDIDMCIPFTSKSFASTEEMYETLFEVVKSGYKDNELIQVRKQRKSIGLLFSIDDEECKVDLVPIKLSNEEISTTAGYLYQKGSSIFDKSSYTKTDIDSGLKQKMSKTQRELLVSFKVWKKNFSVPIGSHLLRYLILDAYKKSPSIPRDYNKKIIMVVRHIRENILHMRLVSAENTNNVLTDLDYDQKTRIESRCSDVLNDYSYQQNSILKYFT